MKRFLCLWLGVCLSGPASLWAADAKRPNILFAFADDWGRYAGAYARLDGPGTINDVVRTPNFDRVAREGVLFRRAFVSAPRCTPCRSALLSGQHFWRTGRGAILLGAVWDGSQPAYPLLLRDAGYHIGEMYKVWGPGTPADAPYGAGNMPTRKPAGGSTSSRSTSPGWSPMGRRSRRPSRALYDEVGKNFDDFLADAARRTSRSATGSDRPTCIASGSRDRARRSGASTRIRCRGNCRRSCPTSRRSARTWPTTSARPRRSTRRWG